MYSYVLCILLPGRAIRTRFFMYSYVLILMYSYVFWCILMSCVFFYPGAPFAPDFLCTRMYQLLCIRMYFNVFLCINSYVFLCILVYSYVFCILIPGRAIRTRFCVYSYVIILMFFCILMYSDVFWCILMSYVFFYSDAPSAPDLLCTLMY